MATAKFYLEKRKDQTENVPVVLKYCFNGQRLEYYTGVRIDKSMYCEKYWTKGRNPIKSTAKDAEKNNSTLETISKHLTDAKLAANTAGTPLSAQYFRDYLNTKLKAKVEENDRPITFMEYFDSFIELKKTGINANTGHLLSHANIEKYSAVKNMLIEFCKHRRKQIDFVDFDERLYNELVRYMINQKKYALNTYGRHIKFIKTVLHKATTDGVNTSLKYQKSFVGVTEPSDNAYLTETELEKIYSHDFSACKKLDRVRDLFLIGCWTGLRFSDYSNIKQEHIIADRIKMIAHKTKRRVIIPLHPVVREILTKYNYRLPDAISNQKFNDYVQDVCKDAEINEPFSKSITRNGGTQVISGPKFEFVTSHTARRTFATNAFKRGISPLLIMSITGHKTESEFIKYLKVTDEEYASQFEKESQW